MLIFEKNIFHVKCDEVFHFYPGFWIRIRIILLDSDPFHETDPGRKKFHYFTSSQLINLPFFVGDMNRTNIIYLSSWFSNE